MAGEPGGEVVEVALEETHAGCYESTLSPGVFWAHLSNFDLDEGAPTLRLDVAEQQKKGRSGEASADFVAAAPFTFLPVAVG